MMAAAANLNSPEVKQTHRGELLMEANLAPYTSWRVGGNAEILYRPENIDDMAEFIAANHDKDITVLGAGSNVLIRDGGIKGAVIITVGALNNVTRSGELFRVEAGVSCPGFANICRKNQMIGTEFLAGIPGTIGGAVKMNAGAYGAEIWGLIEKVEVIDRCGDVRTLNKVDIDYGYRYCNLPHDCFVVAAYIRTNIADDVQIEKSQQKMKILQKQRSDTQPLDEHNCGSVFKNPEGKYAAKLIEEAGLKGEKIGGAQVSLKHANFIVNTGGATAADIEQLIELVRDKVSIFHGVDLQSEIKILGEKLESYTAEQEAANKGGCE